MKAPHFYITSGIGFLCLVLSVVTIVLNQANGELQADFNRQQEEINQSNASNQALQNLLKDLAALSAKNDKVKDLLSRHGYTVKNAAQ